MPRSTPHKQVQDRTLNPNRPKRAAHQHFGGGGGQHKSQCRLQPNTIDFWLGIKTTIYIYLNTVHRNARKPTAQYTDSCKQEKAGARHSREASSLPHDLPLSPTPNRPGVCLRVRCGMVLRVAGLRLRVREVRRAEMPSALRRSKRAGAYIYVTVVATYTHHCPGRAH